MDKSMNVGEKNGRAKITMADARKIRNLYPVYTQMEIADMYGISQKQVSNIVNNNNWKEN